MTTFVSTAIPYVNSRPHIGFAFELIQADVIARYHRLIGKDTFFVTGTDDNSLKNVRAAKEAGMDTQEFCDQNSKAFEDLTGCLEISNDCFIRTSNNDSHTRAAQKLWTACYENGDIYKKMYKGLYCVGCETFYTEKEVPDGCCPEHKTKLEEVEEENYFFRLTKYADRLRILIEGNHMKITPDSRKNETLAMLDSGLEDFSISRSVKRAENWGIPVPNDDTQIMYVWFDALVNYISSLGYGDDSEDSFVDNFEKYWMKSENRIHVIGKGINRFHTLYWPAMLLSADLRPPTLIFVHGYLTVNGEKISKSLGNAIDPFSQVERFGVDAVRYFLTRCLSPYDDGDYNEARVAEVYKGELANNIGNLVRRLETLGEKMGYINTHLVKSNIAYHDVFRLDKAISFLMAGFSRCNWMVDEAEPWKLLKEGKLSSLKDHLDEVVPEVLYYAEWLSPFLPSLAEKIRQTLGEDKTFKKGDILFPPLKD